MGACPHNILAVESGTLGGEVWIAHFPNQAHPVLEVLP
jgi:hypothetical protein